MRINCVPVEYLTDQHLIAEWTEMLMLPAYLKRSIASKDGLILYKDPAYTLNTNHARFFYDKLGYIQERYADLEREMLDRGFNAIPSLDLSEFPPTLFNNWTPTQADMENNMHRIITRILDKPKWYRIRGKRPDDWVVFYETLLKFKYVFRESDVKGDL